MYTPNGALINETFLLALSPNVSLATLQCAPRKPYNCAEIK